MALDWNKEISFSGLKKRGKGNSSQKSAYPEKTYMNLMVREQQEHDPGRLVLVGILLFLIVVAFSKFGVYDFIDAVNKKQAELTQYQLIYDEYQTQLKDYAHVQEEYEAYGSSMLVSGNATVSAVEALGLVDRIIAPNATVQSINLAGDVLTLRLSNITLDNVGKLTTALYNQPIVSNVSVSTAATQETAASDVVVAMTITLKQAL